MLTSYNPLMATGKPILVTGSHRSGSTWVGTMLALAPELVYIHEPFNTDYFDPGICGARFPHRFTYITEADEAPYYRYLCKTMKLEYDTRAALRTARSASDVRAVWDKRVVYRQFRRAGRRALIKDPLALLSAEWLADRFDMDVIVMIRHPAAFAGSLKRFGWHSPLDELLQQPALLRDYLGNYSAEIATYAQPGRSIIEQAAVFWKVLYAIVADYQRRYPHWTFLHHEDVACAPQARFRELFASFNLTYTDAAAAEIARTSSPDNPTDLPAGEVSLHLDSRASVWNWKQRLTADEIAAVRTLSAPVADWFYDELDWQDEIRPKNHEA